jgi:hypothetical protein
MRWMLPGGAQQGSASVGRARGRTKTSDVIDASVALVAKRERVPVLTSDVTDLRRLDPTLVLERI